jgi:mannosyltransferase
MKGDLQMNPRHRDPTVLILIALLLIGLILRLVHLNDGMWLDEILTLVSYARVPFAKIVTSFDSENQHFLYSVLAHLSFITFGESAWALRLPAVLFGVGSIFALYLIGSEVTSKREALLAATLMTFSYYHIWFSQNARGYTSLLFWTVLSSWFLLLAIRNQKILPWIFYALSAALGVYTHLTMGFVIVGQAIVFLIAWWEKSRSNWPALRRGLFSGFVILGLLVIVLYAPVFNQMRTVIGGSEVSVVQEWKSPLWTLSEFVKGIQIGFSSSALAILALIWFGIGLISYWYMRKEIPLLMILPAIVGAAVTLAIGHHLWPRFFFFTYGFAALIVVRGAFAIAGWATRKMPALKISPEIVGTVISLGIILASALSVPFAYGPKQDYAGALSLVQENLAAGDRVVLIGPVAIPFQQYYQTGWQNITNLDELEQTQTKAQRTWVVYGFPTVVDSLYPELMAAIQQNYQVVKVFPGSVEGGQISVGVRKAP